MRSGEVVNHDPAQTRKIILNTASSDVTLQLDEFQTYFCSLPARYVGSGHCEELCVTSSAMDELNFLQPDAYSICRMSHRNRRASISKKNRHGDRTQQTEIGWES